VPDRSHITVAGHRLEYAWHGPRPGHAPTLVLLHEGLGCVAAWRDWPAKLATASGLGVLVYSRRGYGDSEGRTPPWPLTYMHEEAALLPALLAALAVREAILVGHSDGGSIALIHASRHPVSRLVLLAPHVFVGDLSVASIAEARETFETTDLRDRMARYHRDPEATFRLWNDIWLAPEFRDWSIEDVLPAITAPVLAIQGEHDQYGTLAQIDAIEAGVSGSFQRAVLNARHAPHLEAPEETLRIAAEFV
jgi:pimeloyl-ACP methyl ester carboxylesterase